MNNAYVVKIFSWVLLLTYICTAPAHAGWLQDALGDFVRETLSDAKVLGVTIAAIGFIMGVLSLIFGWGDLRKPIVAIIAGAVIALADTFIGA